MDITINTMVIMNKYKKLLLIALGLIIIGFLIPNSLHINDYYNSIDYIDTTCFDCNMNQQDSIGLFVFIIISIIIIIFCIICYGYEKKKKDSTIVI